MYSIEIVSQGLNVEFFMFCGSFFFVNFGQKKKVVLFFCLKNGFKNYFLCGTKLFLYGVFRKGNCGEEALWKGSHCAWGQCRYYLATVLYLQ